MNDHVMNPRQLAAFAREAPVDQVRDRVLDAVRAYGYDAVAAALVTTPATLKVWLTRGWLKPQKE